VPTCFHLCAFVSTRVHCLTTTLSHYQTINAASSHIFSIVARCILRLSYRIWRLSCGALTSDWLCELRAHALLNSSVLRVSALLLVEMKVEIRLKFRGELAFSYCQVYSKQLICSTHIVDRCWKGRKGGWERENGKMGKWENGKMGKWGNGKVGKWESGEMGKWYKVVLFKIEKGAPLYPFIEPYWSNLLCGE